MAAYAALVSLMNLIQDLQHHPFPPISLDEQQLESLVEKVSFLQEFLEGYTSPFADIDDKADPLEISIADAAYAAEDVIESHIVDVIKLARSTTTTTDHDRETVSHGEKTKSISSDKKDSDEEDESGEETRSSPSEEVINCREEVSCISLYEDLHYVIEEMDFIKKEAEKAVVHHQQQQRNVSPSDHASLIRSSSSSTEHNSTTMVCPADVLHGVMEELVGGHPDNHVIPITGMGGIGKTTLARTLYAHSSIKEHFDICGWATISQQYNTREILCELLSQATNKKKEELSAECENELGLALHKYLFGRRFLIVMDDMWSIGAWDEIQHFFPNNDNGSRILVTTRESQLSSQLNNNYSHQMEFLDEVSSWDLFSKTVFGEESCPVELVEIGKAIVENCRGLPLSIVVVGGLLKKKEQTQGCWESIRNDLTWVVNLENDKHCLRLLKKSYDHLPIYLKPCFLYMGVFEEDRSILVSRLFMQWVSEGFLKPMNGKSMETTARGFLKDLVDRNLILIDRSGSTGIIKSCKIHDLVRDLCLRESRKYGFYDVVGEGSPQGINSQRRVVIRASTSKKKVADALRSMSVHTRSVICENEQIPPYRNLRLLRTVVHASRYRSNQRYKNALEFECANLRHLAVRFDRSSFSSFISSVNLVWNLHTLIVVCSFKKRIHAPVGIWKMPQFRHIEFIGNGSLRLPNPPPPRRDGGEDDDDDVMVMENLDILKGVLNFKCGEEVIRRIPNVRKLGIRYLDGNNDDDYCLSNIEGLCKLEFLYVRYWAVRRGVDASLHKLTFPHSLKRLELWMHGEFEWEEMMLEKIGSLPLLQKLILAFGCFKPDKWEIGEGQFPNLKYLELKDIALKQWKAEDESSSIFPRLEQLRLTGLEELEEIPCEIGDIPTLQKITLFRCSESAVKSMKGIVEEQMELQGDLLPFHVELHAWWEDRATLLSLAGPNFKVDDYNLGFLCLPDPPPPRRDIGEDDDDDVMVMENLEILKGVENFKCGEEVVKRIPNIKKLDISYGDADDDYCLSNIESLCKLESLRINFYNYKAFSREFDSLCKGYGYASLHKLTFPHSLKSLTLSMNSREFEWEEMMLEKIGSLPLLQKLILAFGCFKPDKWEIGEGQFPNLKYLELKDIALKQWKAEDESSSIFPRLEQLRLTGLEELEEIPCEIGDIPTLQKITLFRCSESAVKSMKGIVEEQMELQGDLLPFHVELHAWGKDKEALRSLAGRDIPTLQIIKLDECSESAKKGFKDHFKDMERSFKDKELITKDLERVIKGLSHPQRSSQASEGNIAENLLKNFIIEKNIFSDSNQNRGQIEEMNNEAKSEVSMNEVLDIKTYLQDFTLFFSVLPHDYEFTKDILVWQWMVGGLVELGEDIMEEVCRQCFDTLLDMDYFVPSGYDYIFHQMKYRIGGGMTVFLQKQTLEPKFGKYFDCKTSYASEVEHMSLTFKDIKCMELGVLKQYSRLQTLVIYGSYGVDHLPSDIFLQLKTLKILNLSGTNIAVLPSSIENLKELRFFDMSKTPIRWLPETIRHFSNLQTLNLDGCLQLGRLPKCTDKLINLQHLILDVRRLQSMPVGICKLSNLQTLNAFLVGESCVGELKHLKKLRGSFCLLNLENVGSKEEASDACLDNKVGLSKIELQWSDIQDEKCPSEEEILESLKPPISIQELKIQFYSGGVLPSWICDPSFRNLASVILHRCRYCPSLPSLGELPSLKSLSIIENNEVVEIDSSFFRKQANQNLVAFPKLEKLSFESMSKLEKWTGLENGDFPSLQHLIIEYCPKFVGLPFLSCLNSLLQLEIRYCSELSCLPEDGLPPSLKSLMIKQTPKLKAQCCDEQWQGWSKIARVPAIYIDDREFSPKVSS